MPMPGERQRIQLVSVWSTKTNTQATNSSKKAPTTMGSSLSTQSSSALKYDFRDSWTGTDLTRCSPASGFGGCAWKSGTGVSRQCSYVNTTQSFTYYPSAAPAAQTVYNPGDVNNNA